jgi:hypothetical protein
MGKCGSPERQRPDIQQNYLRTPPMTDEKYDLPEKVWVCRGNFGLHCQLDKPTGDPEGAFYVPQAQVAAAYQRAAELIENYDGEILECELHYAAAEIRAMMEEK